MDVKQKMTDEMVEEEIARLQQSHYVKLARKEERIRYARRQYMYTLRMYEKKGKALEAQGITLDELEKMDGDLYEGERKAADPDP